MPHLCDTICEKWSHGRELCGFLLQAEGAAGLLSGAGSVCSVSVPRLGHLQQRVLSRLCWWQWEVLYWKDTGAGYCLWPIPCSQHGGSHPRGTSLPTPPPADPVSSRLCNPRPTLLSCSSCTDQRAPDFFPFPPGLLLGAPMVFGALLAAGGCCMCSLSHPESTHGHHWYSPAHLPRDSTACPPAISGHHKPVCRRGMGGDPP